MKLLPTGPKRYGQPLGQWTLALALLAGSAPGVNAADESKSGTTTTNSDATTESTGKTTTAASTDKTTSADSTKTSATATATSKTTNSGSSSKTTDSGSSSKTTATGKTTSSSFSYSVLKITAVNSNNDASSNTGSMAKLSSTQTSNSMPAMPTLSSTSSTAVATPTVTVPSNSNNPFMRQSSLPEGTVFIAVGAILGGIVVAIFAWHIALAFIHKRNLKKFTSTNQVYTAPFMDESKDFYSDTPGTAGAGTFGGHAYRAGGTNRKSLVPGAGKDTENSASERTRSMINSGLFFSPTAEVMNSVNHANQTNDSLTSSISTAGVGIATNARSSVPRASVYMPAGYYGGSQGGAPSMMSGGRSVRHMSMTNASMTGGPPPGGAGGRPGSSARMSHLNVGGGGPEVRESVRAPSAYLDDFLGADK